MPQIVIGLTDEPSAKQLAQLRAIWSEESIRIIREEMMPPLSASETIAPYLHNKGAPWGDDRVLQGLRSNAEQLLLLSGSNFNILLRRSGRSVLAAVGEPGSIEFATATWTSLEALANDLRSLPRDTTRAARGRVHILIRQGEYEVVTLPVLIEKMELPEEVVELLK